MNASHAAKTLGGETIGSDSVLCPGPGHSPRDRSLHVTFSPTAPEGFVTRSYANDDFGACRDHVRNRLGLEVPSFRHLGPGAQLRDVSAGRASAREGIGREVSPSVGSDPERQAKTRFAVALWKEAIDPRGTLVERYFAVHREGLELGSDICGRVLRFHAAGP
jgi:putative DNA primase/helicase